MTSPHEHKTNGVWGGLFGEGKGGEVRFGKGVIPDRREKKSCVSNQTSGLLQGNHTTFLSSIG